MSSHLVSTVRLEAELMARGLLPKDCRMVQVRIEPQRPVFLRFEVAVRADQLGLFADALKAAADAEGAP